MLGWIWVPSDVARAWECAECGWRFYEASMSKGWDCPNCYMVAKRAKRKRAAT